MKNLVCSIILLVISSNIFSQGSPIYEWTKAFGGVGDINPESSALCSDQSIVTLGYLTGTIILDMDGGGEVTSSGGDINYWIRKSDSDGNYIWGHTLTNAYHMHPTEIRVDEDDNVYVYGGYYGYFGGTPDLDPGPSVFLATDPNGVCIIKLDSDGNFIWAKTLPIVGGRMGVDTNGDVVLSFNLTDPSDLDPGAGVYTLAPDNIDGNQVLLKLSSDGEFLWAKMFEGGNLYVNQIKVVEDGNILLNGRYATDFDVNLDPAISEILTINPGISWNAINMKLNPDGELIWHNTYTQTGNVFGRNIIEDTFGNYYVSGYFRGTFDADTGLDEYNLTAAETGLAGAYIIKLNNVGEFIWGKTHESTVPDPGVADPTFSLLITGLNTDLEGNLYTCGLSSIEADFDFGPEELLLSPSDSAAGTSYLYIQKIDPDGNLIWVEQIGEQLVAPHSNNEHSVNFIVNENNEIFAFGSFYNTVDFDPTDGIDTRTSVDNYDGFMLKLSQCSIDSDEDGICDYFDLDDDNDGIPDLDEDLDEDGDGDPTTDPTDTDGDGIPDMIDLDSDNDGISDIVEAGGTDEDGNGVIDGFEDLDGDGLDDTTAGAPLENPDSDQDGRPNYLDLDSDNDGILDIIEAGGVDTDGDGQIDGYTDVDGDGYADVVDTDDNTILGAGDGGTALDVPNTDGTGGPDFLDIDADGDGIVDNIEGQSTGGYTPPTGTDSDGDGIDDAYDVDAGGTPIGDYDHDGDGNPDYTDLDSDNDGESDLLEGHDTDGDGVADTVPTGTDSDNDGLDDAFDTVVLDAGTAFTNAGNGTVDPLTDGVIADADVPGVGNLDFRENDSDGDSIDDDDDLDDDNDGIPDLVEDLNEDGDNDPSTNPTDTDGDGIPDILDLDSDNDGIADIVEAGGADENNDGLIDNMNLDGTLINDSDNDGLDDLYDGDNGGADIPNPDTDEDGRSDFQDVDSDNDGIHDIIESGGSDENGDGVIDDFNDENGDGLDDNDGGVNPPDTDGDGVPDFQDVDSDNDSVTDSEENDPNGDGPGPDDTDGDGIPDYQDTDDDNDGVLTIDESDKDELGNYTDCDSDGTPDYLDPDSCALIVPSGFSPNGDGINDFYIILGAEDYGTVNVRVYSRWGSLVYESDDYKNNWDGTNQLKNGEQLPVGTYFIIVTIEGIKDPIKNYIYIAR